MLKKRVVLFIIFIISSVITAQQPDPKLIKEVIISANNIETRVYNYGSLNDPMRWPFFKWKKLSYLAEFGPLVAAEVEGEDGNLYKIVSDTYIDNRQGDYSPADLKWGFLPVPNFINESSDEPANYLNPGSWPDEWNGVWPYGSGEPENLRNEVLYEISDLTNAEFSYYPFPSDTTKRGLGVSVKTRITQLGGALKNTLLLTYTLKNVSEKDLSKIYFGFNGDVNVGGGSDYLDDNLTFTGTEGVEGYYSSENIIMAYDKDQMGAGGGKTGRIAFKFLETPESKGLTSFNPLKYMNGFPNVPANDELMYNLFSSGIDTTLLNNQNGFDAVVNFGTGPFDLATGDSVEVKLAIFLAYGYKGILEEAERIARYHHWPSVFDDFNSKGGNEAYKFSVDQPGIVNGVYDVNWQLEGSTQNANLYLEYTRDGGKNWAPLVYDLPAGSSYSWNTEELKDGANYALRGIAYNPENMYEYYHFVTDRFIIDKTSEDAQPEIDYYLDNEGDPVYASPIQIDWKVYDADTEPVNFRIEYFDPVSEVYKEIYNENLNSGEFSYDWDVLELPNSYPYRLRMTASDGSSDSTVYTRQFEIKTYSSIYSGPEIEKISGTGTPQIRVEVPDVSAVSGDDYEIAFAVDEDSNKTYSVKNISTNELLGEGFPVHGLTTTPLIEGFKVRVKEREPDIDYDNSGFTEEGLEGTYNLAHASIGSYRISSEDWMIIFNDPDTTANGNFVYPGDTTLNVKNEIVETNFRVINLEEMAKATYRIMENKYSINGKFDPGEKILLQPQGATGAETCYEIKIDVDSTTGRYPAEGDTLYVRTYNRIADGDIFRFTTGDGYQTKVEQVNPLTFGLSQNYPNPFNPATVINYQIPEAGNVKLKVYDVLGREVASLVNEHQAEGRYEVKFDASHLSSGVYLYRIEAGKYVSVKKMMLLK